MRGYPSSIVAALGVVGLVLGVAACAESGKNLEPAADLSRSATTDLALGDLLDSTTDLAVPDLASSLLANGLACVGSYECLSGYCVDGVCCTAGCNGLCESCVLPGTIGVCTPVEDGEDPDDECPGTATLSVDGGLGDGGDFSAVDGGNFVNFAACAGRCNGKRACGYPGDTKSCGEPYCSESNQSARFVCDGKGGCSVDKVDCEGTFCSGGMCPSQCSAHTDCTAGYYCNGVTSRCAPLKVDGLLCTLASECEHGFCAPSSTPGTGVCCDQACSPPGTCTAASHEGQCRCGNTTCAAGVACKLFYRDLDQDTFGDKFGTLENFNARAGCTGDAPPAGFVDNALDCDDFDMRANPNASGYFAEPSLGRGIWDYDCDGDIEKETREHVSGTCKFCSGSTDACTSTSTCQTAGQGAVLTCEAGTTFCSCGGFLCLCSRCGAGIFSSPSAGFVGTVACGNTGTYRTCGSCATANGGVTGTTDDFSKKQQCR